MDGACTSADGGGGDLDSMGPSGVDWPEVRGAPDPDAQRWGDIRSMLKLFAGFGALPCEFGCDCARDAQDDVRHYLEVRVLSEAAGAAACGGLARSPVDRMALGYTADETERVDAFPRLGVAAFVPLGECAVVAAERLPKHSHAREAVEQMRGRARERASARGPQTSGRDYPCFLLVQLFSFPPCPNSVRL